MISRSWGLRPVLGTAHHSLGGGQCRVLRLQPQTQSDTNMHRASRHGSPRVRMEAGLTRISHQRRRNHRSKGRQPRQRRQ